MKSIYIRLEENEDLKKSIQEEFRYSNDKTIDEFRLYYDQNSESDTTFDIALVKKYIDEINALYPNDNFKIRVVYKMNEKFILDTEKCKELEKVDNYLRKEKNEELYISSKDDFHKFGFRKTLSANRKLDSIANDIKNASYNGSPLSNFEKFMLAYEYVTNYLYREAKDAEESRHWVPVIEGDKIVCVGYASLLSALCDRIFPPSEVKVVQQGLGLYSKNKPNKPTGAHRNNLIFIKDEKYDIDGLFYVDACWDSKSKIAWLNKPQAYCCIPLKDILHHRDISFKFADNTLPHIYLNQYNEYKDFCDKVYKIEKKKNPHIIGKRNIKESIEACLFSFKLLHNEDVVNYYKNYIADVIEYDVNDAAYDAVYLKSNEYKIKMEKEINSSFKDVFDEYKDVEIPKYLPASFAEQCLKSMKNDLDNTHKLQQVIEVVAKHFSGPNAKKSIEELKKNRGETQSLEQFTKEYMLENLLEIKRLEVEKKREKALEARDINAKTMLNVFNELGNTKNIPLEAFANSYKIIAAMQGLEGKKAENYVKNRLVKSIKKTNEDFNTKKCENCFATAKVADIKKLFAKLK